MRFKSVILDFLNFPEGGEGQYKLLALWHNSVGELALAKRDVDEYALSYYSVGPDVYYLKQHWEIAAASLEVERIARLSGARRVDLSEPVIDHPLAKQVYEKLEHLGVNMNFMSVYEDGRVEVRAEVGTWPEKRKLRTVGLEMVKYPDFGGLDQQYFDEFVVKLMEFV
jgi:hypothetical protein